MPMLTFASGPWWASVPMILLANPPADTPMMIQTTMLSVRSMALPTAGFGPRLGRQQLQPLAIADGFKDLLRLRQCEVPSPSIRRRSYPVRVADLDHKELLELDPEGGVIRSAG